METQAVAPIVSEASEHERINFIQRTYLHLGLAIFTFVALEYLLLNSFLRPLILDLAFSGRLSWLIFLGLFIVASCFARVRIDRRFNSHWI